MTKFDLVVTRHQGLVDFLVQEGILDEGAPVLASAKPEDVRRKRVLGVLPLWLAAEAETVTEAKLELTVEQRQRGDLPADEVRQCFRGLRTYKVLDLTEA